MPVFVLSIHADYACRHSGACCTAGWRIPVERACEDGLVSAGLADPARTFEPLADTTVLALAESGDCVYYLRPEGTRPALCALHRAAGHDALPSACRHFPRVAVTDDAGTFVTLSHFCPTAASMLFRANVPMAVIEAPAAFNSVDTYEGLDARGVLPPLLRDAMLMDLEGHHAWERHIVGVLADERHTAESAIAQIASDAETASAWTPGDESLGAYIGRLGEPRRRHVARARPDQADSAPPRPPHPRSAAALTMESLLRKRDGELHALHDAVRSSVLPGLAWPVAPAGLDEVDDTLVAPAWDAFARPIKCYLAAKAFASWIPWLGGSLTTTVAALRAARAVLRVEAARQCAAAGRRLDRPLLVESIRQSDLLLVHRISARAMTDALRRLRLA